MNKISFLFLILSITTIWAEVCPVSIVGSGISGLYAAHRIVNDENSPFEPKNICIFEALERVGGRIFTLNSQDIEELGDKVLEASVPYFNENAFLTRVLVEDVLGLSTRCYLDQSMVDKLSSNQTSSGNESAPAQQQEPQSELQSNQTESGSKCLTRYLAYANLRNKWLTRDQLSSISELPYNLESTPELGLNSSGDSLLLPLMNADGIFVATEGILDKNKLEEIKNMEGEAKWEEVLNVINQLKEHTYMDVPLHELDIKTVLLQSQNFTREYYVLIENLFTSYPTLRAVLSYNVFDASRDLVIFAALGEGGYKVIDTATASQQSNATQSSSNTTQQQSVMGKESMSDFQITATGGFGLMIETIVKELLDKGVKIELGKTVTGITSVPMKNPVTDKYEDRLILSFDNSEDVVSDHVLLDVGKRQMDLLGFGFYKDISTNASMAIANPISAGAFKIFLYYENAWWLERGFTAGSTVWDGPLREIVYHAAPNDCAEGETSCSGFLQISFVAGLGDEKWSFTGLDILDETLATSPINIFRSNDSRQSIILESLHKLVLEAHQIPDNEVEAPSMGVFANWFKDSWFRYSTIRPASMIDTETFREAIMKPMEDANIHIINGDFSDFGCFFGTEIERSLVLTEWVLRKHIGLEKPSWVKDDDFYYKYVIENLIGLEGQQKPVEPSEEPVETSEETSEVETTEVVQTTEQTTEQLQTTEQVQTTEVVKTTEAEEPMGDGQDCAVDK